MTRLKVSLTVALLACSLGAAIPAPAQVIGVPGQPGTEASGINDAGQIVGSFIDARGVSHGFTQTLGGSFIVINGPGDFGTFADGINAVGQIVGSFYDARGIMHGFVRAPGGALTTIDVPGARLIEVHGITDAGQIAGMGVSLDGDLHVYGFVRTADGTFTTVDVPGAKQTWAGGINNSGQIVGGFRDADGKEHGFVRAANGTFTTFDVPSQPTTTQGPPPAKADVTSTIQRSGAQAQVMLQIVVPAGDARQAVKVVTTGADGSTRTVYEGVHGPGERVSFLAGGTPPFIILVYVAGLMVKQITVPAQ